ncbi:MAG: tetratricopeptide repeat protein [Candidatus Binatia bacterium]
MRRAALLAIALGATGAGWLDPWATARQASRLYAEGKFDDAAAKYNEALVDDPDSALLHFNLGATAYRQGKFEDATATLGRIPSSDTEPARSARTAYNVGNATYRLGAATETSDPTKALEHYAEALVAYRRAMGADPADDDAKFNHEFVEKKMADLKKKLEEQQKDKDQQQQNEQPKDQQGDKGQDQPKPDEPQQGENKPDQQQAEEKPTPQQAQGDEPQGDERQAEGGATAGGEGSKMSPREAEALLDAQRDQEVRPDEMVQQLQGADVADPREDW